MSKSFEGYIGNRFEQFGSFVICHHRGIVALSVVLTIFCGIGLFFIEPAFDIEKTMGRKVPYVNKFLNLCETELGSMYAYDLMITLPHDNDAKKPRNLQKLDLLSKIADDYKLTKRHNSITDIVKDMNCTLNGNKQQFYTIPNNADMVAQLLLLYENAGGTESEYWMDYNYKRLRLQIELKDYNSNEAEKEMNNASGGGTPSLPRCTRLGGGEYSAIHRHAAVCGARTDVVDDAVGIGDRHNPHSDFWKLESGTRRYDTQHCPCHYRGWNDGLAWLPT